MRASKGRGLVRRERERERSVFEREREKRVRRRSEHAARWRQRGSGWSAPGQRVDAWHMCLEGGLGDGVVNMRACADRLSEMARDVEPIYRCEQRRGQVLV